MSLALWLRALLAAHILVSDPHGFGGIILRARAGPVRESDGSIIYKPWPTKQVSRHPCVEFHWALAMKIYWVDSI